MGWPVTINGNTYQNSDFSPYGYAVAFPAIIGDVATVAGQVETNKTTSVNAASTATTQATAAATSKSGADTAAAAAAVSQTAAGTSATNAATSETNAVAAAAQIAALKATSTTSLTIAASGDFTFTIQSGKGFIPGTQIFAASAANPTARNMTMIVKSYSGTSLVATATAATGATNTAADWNIFTLGAVTLQGVATDPATFALERYRNQLDDWRALLVPDRPSLFQRFTDNTYFLRDKIVTSYFSAFLAATSGVFTRASAGTAMSSAGNLTEFAAGAPRITDRGMGIESTGTNLVRNPRCEGAVVGSPGTAPTYMNIAMPSGISQQVTGTGKESGVPGFYVRFYGTAAASGSINMAFEPSTAITAAQNDTFTTSVYAMLVAGTSPSFRLSLDERATGGGYLAGSYTSYTPSPTLTRMTHTRTCTDASAAYVQPYYYSTLTSGQTVDFTLFVGGQSLEKNTAATSLILPPVGSPAQATRAAEDCIFTRAIPAAFSKAFIALPRRYPIPSGTEVLWQVDDGTSNNRIYVARLYTGSIVLVAVVGGVTTANLTIGIVAENTEFKVALRAAGNNWAASLNGAAVVTDTTSAMPTGLTYERLGNTSTGLRWNGTIKQNTEFPALLTNTQLQALAA
ncbi:MAG: hypothetical protein M9932_04125 [Xanthobacteraceae bacterium]|nr:hypothetical protein [Xanthobacteraceae bacterium]